MDGNGMETFKAKGGGKAPAPVSNSSYTSKSTTNVSINLGGRSSYGSGYGYGYRPSSLTEAFAVGVETAVIKNNTNLLCKGSNQSCVYDNDCCNKSCYIIEGSLGGRPIKRCS
jgi:hypothetical protein